MDAETETDIPAWLLRNPDNSPPDARPPASGAAPMTPSRADVRPAGVASDVEQRQKERRQAQDERKKQKSYARIGKMKAVQADRDAAKAGKTWDPNKAEWV